MTWIIAVSIAIRLLAMVWSLVLWRRMRDWRMGFLTLMIALMALRQALALIDRGDATNYATEIPGVLVSVLSVLAVFFLGQMLLGRNEARERLGLLEAAVNSAREGIFITDANLGERGPRIVFVNEGLKRITGRSEDELVGQTPDIFHGPKTDLEVVARIKRELAKGLTTSGTKVLYRKDGSDYLVDWEVSPVRDASGNTTHFVSVQRDISGRRRLEEQLLRAQKMESMGRLAGGVAHDFNNLLTAIIGYAELVERKLPPDDATLGRVRQIRAVAERASALTNQLLAFARRQLLEPRVIQLNEIVLRLDRILRRLIGEDIELVKTLQTDLPPIKVDPTQLEQCLVNFAVNARDAMPQGGKLRIETSAVTLDEEFCRLRPEAKPGQYVLLSVTDTGVGMDEEVQQHVFEPFFTTKEEGTGLGLATTYAMVKQSGGYIEVQSKKGLGTTFRVYLPSSTEPLAPSPQPEEIRELPRGFETILLAEDEPSVRSLADHVLREQGYETLVAKDGDEALSIVRQHRGKIHMLLTDVVMPNLGGRELALRMRDANPSLKVLYITGYAESALEAEASDEAGVGFLQKPFTPTVLAEKVRKLLDSERASASPVSNSRQEPPDSRQT